MTGDQLPARIDRATFDRVLQRAAEIQASSKDIGDGLSEDEIVALGAEVGIPAQHLRQALLEERTRVVPHAPEGIMDRWVGVADLTAERVVQGTPDVILAALARWLEHHEHFVVQRATIGRTTFEPMGSLAGAMRRVGAIFDSGRSKPYLDNAETVTAVVTPLEAGFCHVSLAAQLGATRRNYVIGASALGGFGVVAGAVVLALGAPELVALAPVLGGAGGGVLTTRAFKPVATRARLGLERTLDELERRPSLGPGQPAGPSSRLARDVSAAVREITVEVRKAFDR